MPGKPVIDFTISGHHNYVAAGMIHHNSWVAAFEVAMHMTGEYPDWWQGRRFDKPVHVWTGSPTNESSRDVCQKYLLGGTDDSRIGTGTIPHSRILGKLKMRQCGVSNVVDEFRVKHVSGGYSYCNLKCHPVDERALMADGTWRQMIDVMVGEKVRCADGVDRVVDQKHCYLSAPVMAIDTRSGTIRGTPNHPVFTQRGKLRMDELQVGDVLEVADCDIRALLNPRLAGPRGEVVGIRNLEDQTVVGVGVEDVHELIVEGFRVGNSYEQGWRKWQGTEPDIIWMDEEPEDSSDQRRIYTEALTRLLTSHGIMMVTFTPLMGQTQIVDHFQHGGSGVWLGTATWDDAPHLNIEERKRLADSYPRYELQARTMGVPMLGEGRIFETPEEQIVVQPFELPSHYARIIGLDFGLDHPTAIACCAWDRDRDIFYVYDVYKRGNRDTIHHAEAIIRRDGDKIPVAWPHDGTIREKGSGKELQQIYRGHGVRMLSRSARYDNDVGGSQPQWPIINEVQERCFTDRFKVFSHCREFFEEYRHYHTKDGKIVPRNDDILKATFYALMMRRFASHGRMVPKQPAARPILTTRV